MKKKLSGWKIALIILALLLIVFFAWVLLSDDEDDYDYDEDYGYEEDYYYEEDHDYEEDHSDNHSSDSGDAITSVDHTGTVFEKNDAVRDKLVQLKGNGQDTVTVLVYMNGSDLESDDGSATEDLTEMVAAGSSDKVNVIVETLGTRKWKGKYRISSETAQRHKLNGNGLELIQDDLGSLNCGDPAPLSDFIKWGVKNYPADRYILLFWDHGGGPVYGFGYDDSTKSEDSLTIAEIQKALRDAGTEFDFIGMDCCIMSSVEVCCALYDFCDYTILSEDFESGSGWSYTEWIKALYEDSSIPTPELGKIIVNNMVFVNSDSGENAILAVIDESYMKLLYQSWVDFAYANEDTLLGTNYSRKKTRKAGYRISPILEGSGYFKSSRSVWDYFEDGSSDEADFSEYYITDMMALAENVSGKEASALSSSLYRSLVYMSSCGESSNLTGFSITLPYGDYDFYDELKDVFLSCGFDSGYVEWLSAFAGSESSADFYDYDNWDSEWEGWDDYEDDYDWEEWDDWDDWDDDSSCWGWSDCRY